MELGDVNVQGTVETQGSGQGRNDLGDKSVQICVGRALDIEIPSANVIKRLVVDLIGDIGVLQKRMHTQDGVVGFDHGGGHLRAAPDGERDLGFLAVIDGQSFHQQRAKTTSGTTTDGVINLFFFLIYYTVKI